MDWPEVKDPDYVWFTQTLDKQKAEILRENIGKWVVANGQAAIVWSVRDEPDEHGKYGVLLRAMDKKFKSN